MMLRTSSSLFHEDSEGITHYHAYEQRHVMTLKPATLWNEEEVKLQVTYNRFLQPAYLHQNPDDIIKAARSTSEKWLTDFASLTLPAALYFHVCAELLTFYKLDPFDCLN